MKKNYLFTLLLTLSFSVLSFGQEMLLNGGFENWDDNTTPTDWTKVENTTKEATEKHGGSFAAKHVGGTKDLGQTISSIIVGDSYTMTVWYKVESGDATSARIWSYWKIGSSTVTDSATDDDIRGPNGSYFDNNGNVWAKYEVTVTAPAGVDTFYFELRTYSGATVYWDDLSFMHNVTASTTKNSIEGFKTYPNPITDNKLTVASNNTNTKAVSIFNVLGKEVFSTNFSGLKKELNVSKINSGIYILRVTEGGKTSTKKLVIK